MIRIKWEFEIDKLIILLAIFALIGFGTCLYWIWWMAFG